MENITTAFSVVFPMMVMFTVGYMADKKGIMDEASFRKLNKLCFKVFFCATMFRNMVRLDFDEIHVGRLWVYTGISMALLVVFSFIFVIKTEKDNRKRGFLIQAVYRSNYLIFGLEIVESLYGADAAAIPSLLSALVIPINNVMAVIALELFRENGEIKPGKLIMGILKNPLILGVLSGVIVSFLRIPIPALILGPINTLAGLASPLALIVLGSSFTFKSIGKYKKYLIRYGFIRLVGVGVVFLGAAALLGFRDVELATLIGVYATPVAASSYVMTQQMGGDDELASSVIVVTSVGAMLTIFLWIFLFKNLGML